MPHIEKKWNISSFALKVRRHLKIISLKGGEFLNSKSELSLVL